MVKIQLDSCVDKAIFQNHGGLIPTTAGETVADTKCLSISNPVALQTNE